MIRQAEVDGVIEKIGRSTADAWDCDMSRRAIPPSLVRTRLVWLTHRLRNGRELEYNWWGTGPAYLLQYMPQRTLSAWLALQTAQPTVPTDPVRILDIGSGTDAVSLAAALLGWRAKVACSEPAEEMRRSASALALPWTVSRQRLTHSLEDVIQHRDRLAGPYDLVALSAALPYGFGYLECIDKVLALLPLVQRDGHLVIIEPHAKRSIVDDLQLAADAHGIVSRRADSLSLSTCHLRRTLPAIQSKLSSLEPMGEIQGIGASWGKDPDHYLFVQKR